MQRRKFLTTTAAATAMTTTGLLNQTRALGAVHTFDESKKYRVGLIGTGWYGKVDLFRLMAVAGDEVEVVGLCDVDKNMLSEAAKLTVERQKSDKQPALYGDYRKLLADQDLDIAIVGTPDHWHALPMIEACQAGCDVYVQKPVGVDFIEGESMVAAARKYDRIVQVGTQRRSTPHLIEARDKYITSGKIGSVGRVEIHSYFAGRFGLSGKPITPPPHLDYEMWTGPAPMRPLYERMLPVAWRAFKEYGNGAIGDLCVHFFDLARYFLDLGWPQQVSCIGGEFVDTKNPSNIPDTQDAIFKYPELNIVWTNRAWGNPIDKDYPWAISIYGSQGTLRMNLERYDFTPKNGGEIERGEFLAEEVSELERKEPRFDHKSLGATRRHLKDFFESVKTRQLPVADILEGHISSSACVLANNAMDLGRTLSLDPKTGRPIDDEAATKLLAREYRQPWVHPTAESI